MVTGRRCTAYPAIKPDWSGRGRVAGRQETFSNAVVDGNLVTAAAWPGHPEWMRKFLRCWGRKSCPNNP